MINKTINDNKLILIRSLLIFPGHVEKYFLSAKKSNADAIVIDLEDSVPSNEKDNARNSVISKIDNKGPKSNIFVRVNGIHSGRFESDIEAILHKDLTGIVLPMVESKEDILFAEKVISKIEADLKLKNGYFSLFPLIELPVAVLNIASIATASKRIIGLIFGHEDYLLHLQAPHTIDRENISVPRALIPIAARSIGGIPIDTPYLDIGNTDGCMENVLKSKTLGYSGMLTVHPSQIEIVNNGYSPTQHEILEAKKIVEQVKESAKQKRSITFSDCRFVGPPISEAALLTLKRAEKILEISKKIKD